MFITCSTSGNQAVGPIDHFASRLCENSDDLLYVYVNIPSKENAIIFIILNLSFGKQLRNSAPNFQIIHTSIRSLFSIKLSEFIFCFLESHFIGKTWLFTDRMGFT